jgi:hypothetical protein
MESKHNKLNFFIVNLKLAITFLLVLHFSTILLNLFFPKQNLEN